MSKVNLRQRTIEVEGTEYVLQHPGTRNWVKMRDRAQTSKGLPSEEKLYEEIMKHVVVNPKVDFDYFDEHEGFDKVMMEALKFLNGAKELPSE